MYRCRRHRIGDCLFGAGARFSALNVEGRGFGTWQNLLKKDHALGELRTLEVSGDAKAVRLIVDGAAAGERPRDGKSVSETKRILVRAGEQVKANFSEESIVAAAKKESNVVAAADAGR